jgi:HAD superfamily hydrolase (TIGR01662 family)
VTQRSADFDVVVPTVGRPQLATLLTALDRSSGPRPRRVVVVDDRRSPVPDLDLPALVTLRPELVRSGGRGPAAARNTGWRRCGSPWIAFLDDDVVPSPTWFADLASDLECAADESVAASQGVVRVPLPPDRRPTDDERGTANLARAAWITADLVVRRAALTQTGGFDERFRRAYREDTELALRLFDHGWSIAQGRRTVDHPPRGGDHWRTSIRAQRGNADDALVRRLHGPDWRDRGRSPRGALRTHVMTTVAAGSALVMALVGHRRLARLVAAAVGSRIIAFWWQRARLGPATVREWGRLAVSSAVIPAAASFWSAWGHVRARLVAPRGAGDRWSGGPPALVLFDRDGTLVHDVPYNGDPDLVAPVADARSALDRLRSAGIMVGLVTNQSGVARGLLGPAAVDAVNRRIEDELGPFDVLRVCTHGEDDRCGCRKPAPGMVLAAAARLGVPPHRCAVVGDIASDVEAGLAAGARAVLVPNAATATDEIAAAPEVAPNLTAATALLLGDRAPVAESPVPGSAP